MSRHLVKAKTKDNKEWVEGHYISDGKHHYILKGIADVDEWSFWPEYWYAIDPETLCRNTGHPNNIYEGDEVMFFNGVTGHIVWNEHDMCYKVVRHTGDEHYLDGGKNWQPTGKNIHD